MSRRLFNSNNFGSAPNRVAPPTIVSLSQDYSSTAGGDPNTITGTNLSDSSTKVFVGGSGGVGGTQATVLSKTATTAMFTCPALSASAGYDVYVTNSGGTSNVLSAALEYLAGLGGPSDILAYTDGHDGTYYPFIPLPTQSSAFCSVAIVTTAPVNWLGDHAIRCGVVSGSSSNAACLEAPAVAADLVTYPNKIYVHSVMNIPSAAVTALGTQEKTHLFRTSDSSPNGYVGIIGTDSGTGPPNDAACIQNDFSTGGIINVNSGVRYGDLVQIRRLIQYSYNAGTGKGTGRVWLQGKKFAAANITDATFLGAGAGFQLREGTVFADALAGAAIELFIGFASLTHGCPVLPAPYAAVTPQSKTFVGAVDLVDGSPTTISFAVPNGATGLVGIRVDETPVALPITDNKGNVYKPFTPAVPTPGGNNFTVFKCDNMVGASAGGLVITTTDPDGIRATFMCFAGCDPISGFDQVNAQPEQIGTGTTADGGVIVGRTNQQLSWGFVATDGDPVSFTASAGWTKVAAGVRSCGFYRIDATPTTVHCQPTLGASVGWGCFSGTLR